MDLTAFNRLPLDEKTNYMWDHGVCLAQRIVENRYILCIFELNGFYVEAIYSRRNNRVNAILPIADLPEWEGYVDQVLINLLHLNESFDGSQPSPLTEVDGVRSIDETHCRAALSHGSEWTAFDLAKSGISRRRNGPYVCSILCQWV